MKASSCSAASNNVLCWGWRVCENMLQVSLIIHYHYANCCLLEKQQLINDRGVALGVSHWGLQCVSVSLHLGTVFLSHFYLFNSPRSSPKKQTNEQYLHSDNGTDEQERESERERDGNGERGEEREREGERQRERKKRDEWARGHSAGSHNGRPWDKNKSTCFSTLLPQIVPWQTLDAPAGLQNKRWFRFRDKDIN